MDETNEKTMEVEAIYSNVNGEIKEAQGKLEDAKDHYTKAQIFDSNKDEYYKNHKRVENLISEQKKEVAPSA